MHASLNKPDVTGQNKPTHSSLTVKNTLLELPSFQPATIKTSRTWTLSRVSEPHFEFSMNNWRQDWGDDKMDQPYFEELMAGHQQTPQAISFWGNEDVMNRRGLEVFQASTSRPVSVSRNQRRRLSQQKDPYTLSIPLSCTVRSGLRSSQGSLENFTAQRAYGSLNTQETFTSMQPMFLTPQKFPWYNNKPSDASPSWSEMSTRAPRSVASPRMGHEEEPVSDEELFEAGPVLLRRIEAAARGETLHPLPTGPTTMMLRNYQKRNGQQKLMDQLDWQGLQYDFVYLPFDFSKKSNLGYAFINFTTPEQAEEFRKSWHTKQLDKQKINISVAEIQGRDANIVHLFRQCKTSKITNRKFLPAVFDDDLTRIDFKSIRQAAMGLPSCVV